MQRTPKKASDRKATNRGCRLLKLHHLPPVKKPRSFPGVEAETSISEPPFRQSATTKVNCCSPNLHCLPIPSAPYRAPLQVQTWLWQPLILTYQIHIIIVKPGTGNHFFAEFVQLLALPALKDVDCSKYAGGNPQRPNKTGPLHIAIPETGGGCPIGLDGSATAPESSENSAFPFE